jgi:hypothetical protein
MAGEAQAPGGAAGEILRDLETATSGLLYSSESDRPFHLFQHDNPVPDPLTAEAFAALVGADPGDPIEEWTIDRFFLPHIELVHPLDQAAWARVPRYDALKNLLRSRLRDVRVFRVGRVQVRCFVVGRDPEGKLVGLETVAVET